MKITKINILFIFLITILIISGCGLNSQKKITKETLTIGALLPLTGDAAVLGKEVQQAIKLAADRYNEGNSDKQINVIFEDTKCNGRDAVTGLQKMLTIDNVEALIGPICSAATLAVAPIAEQYEIILISPASTNPTISDAGDYIFRVVPSDDIQGKAGARIIYDMKFRNGAVLFTNNDYGVGLKDVFIDSFYLLGGNIVAEEAFEQGAADFKTQLTKIKQANPSFIYIVAYPGEAGILLKQIQEMDLSVGLFATEGIKDPSVLESAGEAAEGLILTFPEQVKSKEYNHFATLYLVQYDVDPGTFAAEGYDAFNIIALAYELSETPQDMKDALNALENFNGASGIITFDEHGDVDKPYIPLIVIKGEFIPFEMRENNTVVFS